MPLSEQERRALEELEAQLSAEDPRFASAMVSDPQRTTKRRRVALGALAVVVGLALVVLAVMSRQIWLGAAGFLGMVFGVTYAVGTGPTRRPDLHVVGAQVPRGVGGPGSRVTPGRSRSSRVPRAQGDFMQRLEDRWERRRRENQGW